MRNFKLYDNPMGWTESDFRSHYGDDVREGVMRCCGGVGEEDWCTNKCHFLTARGSEHVGEDGFFPVFGIDCDVEVLCWGGDDVTNSTVEVYCKECAADMHQYQLEQEREAEAGREQRQESERRNRAEQEQKQRATFDFWNNLEDTVFESQCAQLFRDLGFKAETTPVTNDGGIDVVLHKDERRGAAQCKAWGQPCGVREVREFYGVMCAEGMQFGFFISKSGFTRQAEAFLKRTVLIQGWTVDTLVDHARRCSGNSGSPKN